MTTPLLLRGVDVSAFAVALVAKLRAGGVVVSADGPGTLVQAMRHIAPRSRTALYWTARLTLVNRAEDLSAFNAVFGVIFADAVGKFSVVRFCHQERKIDNALSLGCIGLVFQIVDGGVIVPIASEILE